MEQERRAQWLRGVLDLCVLGMLARRESYGYELTRSLDAAGLGVITGGTLYPVLLRLQRDGMITADWREGPSGPARKYYRITAGGLEALRAASGEWDGFSGSVGTILREAGLREARTP